MRKPSCYQAIQMLDAQARGLLRLSDEMFDACFDAVTDLLERANNQKGGAFTRHDQLEPEDVQVTSDGEVLPRAT